MSSGSPTESTKTFWEHLDDLRTVILRIVGGFLICAIVCFCFKETLFDIVTRPMHRDFILYRLIGQFVVLDISASAPLINTTLTGQFMMHLKAAACGGLALSLPYAIWVIAGYLSPALYHRERRALHMVLIPGTLLFYIGVFLSYFLIFPLAYNFLADYSVSDEVNNMITLDSYIDNLLVLSVLMGILFELPVAACALARLGIIDRQLMRSYRRHAILTILIVSAIITPTTDVFTLLLVSLPVYLLYEASIVAVGRNKAKKE